MKLFEIKNVQQKGDFVPPDTKLGSGVQGAAFQHPKQSNSVIKTAEVEDADTDSYVEFVKLAMKHKNNPFFPRIYNAKVVANKNNSKYPQTLVVNMEKLQPMRGSAVSDASKEMLERLGYPREIAQSTDRNSLWYYMNDPKNRDKLVKNTKNPQFKEALTLLEPYFKYFNQDLHADNIMVRLTGSGPQLVILDPLIPS